MRTFVFVILLLFLVLISACQPASPTNIEIPTPTVIVSTETTPAVPDPVTGERESDTAYAAKNELWVDAVHGGDGNDGLTPETAFRTIQRAADLASQGTTVHILPGIYRETVKPVMDGNVDEPIIYLAENGPGTVIIRGSESSQSFIWNQLTENTIGLPPTVDPSNIYYTDLSGLGLEEPPRFVVELDENGEVIIRLSLAREPDWQVSTEWKYHEFWWAADGGLDDADCNPADGSDSKDCDEDSRSTTELTDRTDDEEPPGIEPGNFTTLGDLSGATLVALDTKQGHYIYRRTIISHDVSAGHITVDEASEVGEGTGKPGLGWGTKYYIENKPYLLDTPGEWWYDPGSGHLYLWPITNGDPASMNIEISVRDNGFILKDRSYNILDGLTIEFFDDNAIYQWNDSNESSYYNTIRNTNMRYANYGLYLRQDVSDNLEDITKGFTLEYSEIAFIDTHGIYMLFGWADRSNPELFTHAGIVDTLIRGNLLHHLGFRSDKDNAVGIMLVRADKLRFEDNHIHHVAHNGVQFNNSVIQSPKTWGFTPDEIKTGEILVKDNLFEKACQLTTDCGALKFWGDPPDEHVFRDVLVTGNVFRDTFGWTYVSEKRGNWSGGADSDVQGMGGRGLYVDYASGIHAYRNIAYNNPYAGFVLHGMWRDGEVIYYNNIAANSLYGFRLTGSRAELQEGIDTQFANNIIINNEGYGIWYEENSGLLSDMGIDHNLYYNNGWRPQEEGGMYRPGAMVIFRESESNDYFEDLSGIQSDTPWESNGVEGDPGFVAYDLDDHDLLDGSWPDFHITTDSLNVVDQGTIELPASLKKLLDLFKIQDIRGGSAYDIGSYELMIDTSTSLP